MIGTFFCLFMFVVMFVGLIALLVHGVMIGHIGLIIMGTLFSVLGIPMLVFCFFGVIQELNAFYCDWEIHLDTNEARFELCCKAFARKRNTRFWSCTGWLWAITHPELPLIRTCAH
jgi:hypothetical protein